MSKSNRSKMADLISIPKEYDKEMPWVEAYHGHLSDRAKKLRIFDRATYSGTYDPSDYALKQSVGVWHPERLDSHKATIIDKLKLPHEINDQISAYLGYERPEVTALKKYEEALRNARLSKLGKRKDPPDEHGSGVKRNRKLRVKKVLKRK